MAEPVYGRIAVSPAELRTSFPTVSAGGHFVLHDESGGTQVIRRNTGVLLDGGAVSEQAGSIADACVQSKDVALDPLRPCPLDHVARVNLEKQVDTHWRPDMAQVGVASLLIVAGATFVAGQAYCFAQCGTGGKVAFIPWDVLGAVGAVALLKAVSNGMNH
ncbi:MAG: hypothetical protein NVSMB1_17810 [Polyangiales bacterium]